MCFPGPWPFNDPVFLSCFLSFVSLGESFMALTYEVSKLKTCTLGRMCTPPNPPPPQPPTPTSPTGVVWSCCLGALCQIQGRAYTVSWLVQIKVKLQQPLTCDSSFILSACIPHSPPCFPEQGFEFVWQNVSGRLKPHKFLGDGPMVKSHRLKIKYGTNSVVELQTHLFQQNL